MTNGFYNSNDLSKKDKQRFILDAIQKAYNVRCESKYTTHPDPTLNTSYREIDSRLSIAQSIKHLLSTKDAKLDCVDRFAHGQGALDKKLCEYEICFHTTHGPNNGWLLLYVIVNEDNFNQLITYYNLALIEY